MREETEDKGANNVKEDYASHEEVMAALEELTKMGDEGQVVPLVKLGKIAKELARGKGFSDMDGDLLNEVVCATLEGRRRWNKASHPEFFNHLWWAMRSVVSNWRDAVSVEKKPEKADEPEPGGDVPGGQEKKKPERRLRLAALYSEEGELLHDVGAGKRAVDRAAEARLEVARIMRVFADDRLATDILDGLGAGMTGPEIQEVLGISKQEYETKMKGIRRTLRRAAEPLRAEMR